MAGVGRDKLPRRGCCPSTMKRLVLHLAVIPAVSFPTVAMREQSASPPTSQSGLQNRCPAEQRAISRCVFCERKRRGGSNRSGLVRTGQQGLFRLRGTLG